MLQNDSASLAEPLKGSGRDPKIRVAAVDMTVVGGAAGGFGGGADGPAVACWVGRTWVDLMRVWTGLAGVGSVGGAVRALGVSGTWVVGSELVSGDWTGVCTAGAGEERDGAGGRSLLVGTGVENLGTGGSGLASASFPLWTGDSGRPPGTAGIRELVVVLGVTRARVVSTLWAVLSSS